MITVDFVLFLRTCVLVHIDNFISIPSYRARKFSKSPLVLDIIEYMLNIQETYRKDFKVTLVPKTRTSWIFMSLHSHSFCFIQLMMHAQSFHWLPKYKTFCATNLYWNICFKAPPKLLVKPSHLLLKNCIYG